MSSSRCAMRSRRAERPRAIALALALVLAGPSVRAEEAAAPAPAASAVPRAVADEAAARLRQDPRLRGTERDRELRFKRDDKPKKLDEPPAWWDWMRGFVEWLNDAGRFLMWGLGALLVAVLLLRLRRLWGQRDAMKLADTLDLPTHVNQLDIRPQALPDDIGAAALALWRAGRVQEAMSLLYRGALSRLVHAHAVPIRSSSTEGDCLLLARPRVPAPAYAYLARLVAAWRSTVYAGRQPADDEVAGLCQGFDAGLRAPAAAAAP